MKSKLITGLSLFASIILKGQSVLDGYVTEALTNNQQLMQEALSVRSSQAELGEAKGLYLPTVNLLSDYTLADGGRVIQFPIGDLLNPVYTSLNQINETNAFPTDLENVNEQFFPNDFHDTKIRLIQPLFNSDIYYNRKAQERLVQVSEAQKATYEMELIKEVKVAYFQHLQALESLAIYESNRSVLEESLRFNEKRFLENQITRDEIYRISYELAALDADKASVQEQIATSRAYFNFLLDRPTETSVEVDSSLVIIDFAHQVSIEKALQQRQEIKQLEAAKDAQYQAIKLAQGSKLPQLNGVLDLGYQGNGYTFDNEQQYFLVNLSFSWNIFQGFQNQHRVTQKRIELERLESQEEQLKKQIALEVTRSWHAYMAAQKADRAKQLGHQSASKSFDITSSRYLEGQALLIEFLDAQSNLLTSNLERSIAKYQLLTKEAELNRALAY